MSSYAQIKDGIVVNTVIFDGQPFENDGFLYVNIDNVMCSIGTYYNSSDGKFYEDSEYKIPYGYIAPITSEEAYSSAEAAIQSNGELAAKEVKVPYSDEEVQTWWCQYDEAIAWTANNSYTPIMLNAMVSASNGGWTLSALAANIISNGSAWKTASGNILGQVKAKIVSLNALKAEVDAGTKTVADLQAFDCTITTPTVSLEDKFA